VPGSDESIPDISDLTPVPGNIGLSEGGKAARVREIFRPYHDRIESELDRRCQAGRPSALIALHSFTPVFMSVTRPWHAGVLYNRDPRFALLLMALLKREEGIVVGDNEPYDVNDATDLRDRCGAAAAAYAARRTHPLRRTLPVYATTGRSPRLSRPRHRRLGLSWAAPVAGRGHFGLLPMKARSGVAHQSAVS
jgi:hypothetical protein